MTNELRAIAEAAEVLRPEWFVPDAYVGPVRKEPEATTEDGETLWTAPIECSGGYAQVADVCGGSPREAVARAHAICRALKGGSISHDEFYQIDRLYASDREEDWIAAELITCLVGEHVAITSLLADLEAAKARVVALTTTLHEIDQIAQNTIPPDGKEAAFGALDDILGLINPHRIPNTPRTALANPTPTPPANQDEA